MMVKNLENHEQKKKSIQFGASLHEHKNSSLGFALHWDETLRSLDTRRFEPLTICDTFGKNWDIFQMQFWDTIIMFEPVFGITWNS